MKPETDRLSEWKDKLRMPEPPLGYAEELEARVMNRIHKQSEKSQPKNRWGTGLVVISWISTAAACLLLTFSFPEKSDSVLENDDWAGVEAELAQAPETEIQEWLSDAGTTDLPELEIEAEMDMEWQETDILE